MVKITFSLLSVAAVVASVVSASSCGQETFQGFDSDYRGGSRGNRCIPGVSVKEYQTFQLKSWNLQSMVSKELGDDILVGGVRGNKNFQELELCVVSSDAECNPPYETHCIYENVEYRFKVNGPIPGFLRVVGDFVEIVPNFNEASGLNMQKIAEVSALRVGYKDRSGDIQVFSAPRAGQPIIVEEAVSNKVSQWMELAKTSSRKGRGRFDLW